MQRVVRVCVCLAGVVVGQALGAVVGPAKKAYQDRPDDKRCEHVEVVAESGHGYEIEFAGTIDGTMTRMPIGYSAFVQGWQPNRSVLIENIGDKDVVNPWIVVNGKRNWRTLQDITAEAVGGYTKPADKARAIWEFQRRHRFHACTWDAECSDAVKVLNVYGYTLCGNEGQVLSHLWKSAGLTTRRGYPIGHCVGEVFYDGGFHMMDSDEHVICLKRDNKTIASAADIVRDHDLVKRTHTYSIGRAEGRKTDEFSASLYVHEGKREGEFGSQTRHTMDLTLRPGESIELRWDHIGKQYTAGKALEKGQKKRDGLGDLLAGWGTTAHDNMRNGKLRYRPELAKARAQGGVFSSQNVAFDTKASTIKLVDGSKPGVVTWRFSSPYVFVGGTATAGVTLGAKAGAEWRYSTDEKTWKTLATGNQPGTLALSASLDEVVSPRSKPTYRFWLQLVLRGKATAKRLAFENHIQTSLLGLPELEVGTNQIVYADSSESGRRVRITHRWLERTGVHWPNPPTTAIAPTDGQTVEGTKVTFKWKGTSDANGDAIGDYHFELSEHADMRWPLSPNFEKRISLTPSKGKAEWTVPYVGLLNPDTEYYWRVRALDSTGVWGRWSRAFRFRIRAPGVPLALKLSANSDGGLTLAWRPNPQERPPVAYKVYGSDEKGFSVSDTEHLVFRGRGFVCTLEEYQSKSDSAPDAGMVKTPANLICRVTGTSTRVVGADLALPNTNKAYYRVVAIDEKGNESGPSDYVEVERPFVYTHPVTTAAVGNAYAYRPGLVRSIGDLRCRRGGGSSYNAAFWDREEYTFAAVQFPDGLTIDPKTGLISGKPTKAGGHKVVFKVSNQFGKTKTVSYVLTVAESSGGR